MDDQLPGSRESRKTEIEKSVTNLRERKGEMEGKKEGRRGRTYKENLAFKKKSRRKELRRLQLKLPKWLRWLIWYSGCYINFMS